jgi:tRNA threonylcarbamoyladenosine biosynthesis protein TsaE
MSSVLTFETHSDEETRDVGRQLAARLPGSGLVLLIGDLGAGKTTLTKGIAEGRGAANPDDVSSPTFTLIHEYGDPVSVYHVDLYRLDTAEEVRRLGLDDLLDQPDALLIVEWAERFPELWPEQRTEIRLIHLGEDCRQIEVSGHIPGFSRVS